MISLSERGRQALRGLLIVLLVTGIAGLVVVASGTVSTERPYTEFYVLGTDGVADDYPTNLTTGEEATIIVGIENQEHEAITYRLVTAWNDSADINRRVTVADDETTELSLTLRAPQQPGPYRYELLLYRPSTTTDEPYRTLYLNIRVGEG